MAAGARRAMRLIQFLDDQGRAAGRMRGRQPARGWRAGRTRTPPIELALRLLARAHQSRRAGADRCAVSGTTPYPALLSSGRMLPPLTHPEPHRCLVSGTGLTHLGSAATRDAMHQKLPQQCAGRRPTRRACSSWGVEGGKPAGTEPGVQPEWFYKGNGSIVVGCGQPLTAPSFALDCGEEPELVGLYVISPRRHAAAAGLSPSATSSRITSPSAATTCIWRTRNCASAASGPSCAPARCRAPRRHQPHPARRRGAAGRSRS